MWRQLPIEYRLRVTQWNIMHESAICAVGLLSKQFTDYRTIWMKYFLTRIFVQIHYGVSYTFSTTSLQTIHRPKYCSSCLTINWGALNFVQLFSRMLIAHCCITISAEKYITLGVVSVTLYKRQRNTKKRVSSAVRVTLRQSLYTI